MVNALVLVNIEPQSTETVFREIKKMPGVTQAMMVYGEYDAVFLVTEEHTTGIQDFVKAVRKFHGITRTVTLLELV
jgi:DNA-binding Lrp family transcriptional regulator